MYRFLTTTFARIRVALQWNLFSIDNGDRVAGWGNADDTSRLAIGAEDDGQESVIDDGNYWSRWREAEAAVELSGSHLVLMRGSGSHTCCYGPTRVELPEGRLTLFDFEIHLGWRPTSLFPARQTIGSFRLRDLEAPHFYIRPVRIPATVRQEFLTCYKPVDSPVAHAHHQLVESMFPSAAWELFQTKTAFTELLPYLHDRELTVEWTGETLLVYRLQRTLDPKAFKQFAVEIVSIGEMLRSACAEASAELDLRVTADKSH